MSVAVRASAVVLSSLFVLASCGGAASPATPSFAAEPPRAVFIAIRGFAYLPATIEVVKGTPVSWTNEDTVAHTITSGFPPPSPSPTASPATPPTPTPAPSPGAPTPTPRPLPTGDGRIESGRIENGKVYAFTFKEAGTFDYFCAVHPRMVGKLVVK